jgi:hypothetical protein
MHKLYGFHSLSVSHSIRLLSISPTSKGGQIVPHWKRH